MLLDPAPSRKSKKTKQHDNLKHQYTISTLAVWKGARPRKTVNTRAPVERVVWWSIRQQTSLFVDFTW